MSFTRTLLEEAASNRTIWIAELKENTEQHQAEIASNTRFIEQFEEERQEILEQVEQLARMEDLDNS